MHCDTLHYWPPSCRRIRTGSGGGVFLSLRAELHVTHGFGNMALARPACAVHVMPGCLRAGRGLERDRPPLHVLLVGVARLTVGALALNQGLGGGRGSRCHDDLSVVVHSVRRIGRGILVCNSQSRKKCTPLYAAMARSRAARASSRSRASAAFSASSRSHASSRESSMLAYWVEIESAIAAAMSICGMTRPLSSDPQRAWQYCRAASPQSEKKCATHTGTGQHAARTGQPRGNPSNKRPQRHAQNRRRRPLQAPLCAARHG